MTLPFRGRHHDQESTHDRARALLSTELTEQLPEDDAAWLSRHLEACGECRSERDAFAADHALFADLRSTSPEPPRDLWARTASAIEREAGTRRRGPAGATARSSRRFSWGAPAGAIAGVVALLVVVILWGPHGIPVVPQSSGNVALATPPAPPPPQPTPLTVAAGDVGWVEQAGDGRWRLVISKVNEVCPKSGPGCDSLGEDSPTRAVDLGGTPTSVALSPKQDQLVVQSSGTGTSKPDKVYILPLASAGPGTSANPPSKAPATASPVILPSESPVAVPSATPNSTPSGAIEIASGVTMVGEAAYSADGWLAFSARPADGSAGPDLYLWHAGDAAARQVSQDHRTYFSGWVGGKALVSRVLVEPVGPDGSPEASAGPAATATATDGGPGSSDGSSPEASAAPQFHPMSFLLDPESGAQTDVTQPDVWLPVVDPSRKVTAYWSGTLVPTADGLDWKLGDGQLVLDRWVDPGAPPPSEPATASSEPSTPPTADPSAPASTAPLEVVGPAGSPVPLEVENVAVFKALFDNDGTRLAVWAADDPTTDVGRLYLLVVDPESGKIDPALRPLPGEPALRRFSIDKGRLAWVSPSGQDGKESAVLVLGWQGRNFGTIETATAKDLFIVR